MRSGGPGGVDHPGRGRRSRVARSPWAAIRAAASRGRLRARPAAPLASGSQVTSQTSSHCRGQPALDELDRLDRRPRRAGRLRRGDRGQDPRPDRGMDDRLEVAQRRRVREHDPAERRPVERAVRPSANSPAEPRDRRRRAPARPASSTSRATRSASMTTTPGPLAEPARHGRLAAADRPGHPDPDGPVRTPGRIGAVTAPAPRARARRPRPPPAPSRRRPARSSPGASRRSSPATAGSPIASSRWFLRRPQPGQLALDRRLLPPIRILRQLLLPCPRPWRVRGGACDATPAVAAAAGARPERPSGAAP